MADESNAKPKWLVMVYMAADSTLTNFAIESLKQLRDAADGNSCVVAAQFDAPGRRIARYIFDGTNQYQPLESWKCKRDELDPDDVTDDPDTLAHFINWAFRACPECEHHGLVMWGHGPELLFEPPAKTGNAGEVDRLYFTPVQLASAVREAGKPIDIIGMDACSMSLIEFANELSQPKTPNGSDPLVHLMIASQREVPDLSFPYSNVLKKLATSPGMVDVCKAVVAAYVQSYRDYICNAETEAEPVTLSALYLDNLGDITGMVCALAAALKSSAGDPIVRNAIYEARTESEGFVGGLFVDLCDFCDRLCEASGEIPGPLNTAAADLSTAIRNDPHYVVANDGVDNTHCHGLSIYFPYLKDGIERDRVEEPLVKGPGDTLGKGPGDTLGKGPGDTLGKDLLNSAAVATRYAVRREIIKDTETYYQKKDFKFGQTGWYDFIAGVWSRILAEEEPDNLDMKYSAQQCAVNLLASLSKTNTGGNPPNPGGGSASATQNFSPPANAEGGEIRNSLAPQVPEPVESSGNGAGRM